MQYVATEKAKGICPTGWHIPTKAEFETLATAVSNDGNALKAVGQGTGNGAGTDSSGFSALLAGGRDGNGTFYGLGNDNKFWSSTEDYATAPSAYYMLLWTNGSGIYMINLYKYYSFSIRCLKD